MDKKHAKYNVSCENDFERMVELDLMNVVSGNECTGLTPTPPIDIEEADAYSEIYDIPVEKSTVNTNPPHDNPNLK